MIQLFKFVILPVVVFQKLFDKFETKFDKFKNIALFSVPIEQLRKLHDVNDKFEPDNNDTFNI